MTKQVSIYDVDKENLFDITNYLYPKIKLKFGPEVNLEESYFMLRSFSNQHFGAWKQSV
jgi:hypothetical protein